MMKNRGHDLYLLFFNLFQITEESLMVRLFVDSLRVIWDEVEIDHREETAAEGQVVYDEQFLLETDRGFYGVLYLRFGQEGLPEDFGMMQNAVQMLRGLLKARENEKLLQLEKASLEDSLAEHNKHLKELTGRLRTALGESETKAREAREASQAKDDFLAMISHEMRTPLNPIMGFADLLLCETTEAKHVAYLTSIKESAERELELIDTVLDYTRLDSRSYEPNPVEFDLIRLCTTVLDDARAKGGMLPFIFENALAAGNGPEKRMVCGERRMLMQVLDNLLGNACKYTEKGSVTLRVEMEENEGVTPVFVFSVIDTGIGIEKEDRERLFEPFVQAEGSYSRRFQGMGLGLSISRKIVEILGGTIEVESEPGKGSTFRIRLPIKIVEPSLGLGKEHRFAPGQLCFERPYRVLVVEDAEDNILVIKALLDSYGAHPEVAADGLQGVKRAREEDFDLILMDIALPLMSGFEAAELIRKTSDRNAHTPIVAVTAYTGDEVRKRCLNAGMVDFIAKPIDRLLLFAKIVNVIKKAEQRHICFGIHSGG